MPVGKNAQEPKRVTESQAVEAVIFRAIPVACHSLFLPLKNIHPLKLSSDGDSIILLHQVSATFATRRFCLLLLVFPSCKLYPLLFVTSLANVKNSLFIFVIAIHTLPNCHAALQYGQSFSALPMPAQWYQGYVWALLEDKYSTNEVFTGVVTSLRLGQYHPASQWTLHTATKSVFLLRYTDCTHFEQIHGTKATDITHRSMKWGALRKSKAYSPEEKQHSLGESLKIVVSVYLIVVPHGHFSKHLQWNRDLSLILVTSTVTKTCRPCNWLFLQHVWKPLSQIHFLCSL